MMDPNQQRIEELAALHAIGALDGADSAEFDRLLAVDDPALLRELASLQDTTTAMASAIPATKTPSPGLKAALLQKIEGIKKDGALATAPSLPGMLAGFQFIHNAKEGDWRPLSTPGAYARLLHMDTEKNYAVVVGKLEPGTRYPAHIHLHSEQIYVLEGDLSIGDQVLNAGDFHCAGAGTRHDVNSSEKGCIILAVLSVEDLMAQF